MLKKEEDNAPLFADYYRLANYVETTNLLLGFTSPSSTITVLGSNPYIAPARSLANAPAFRSTLLPAAVARLAQRH